MLEQDIKSIEEIEKEIKNKELRRCNETISFSEIDEMSELLASRQRWRIVKSKREKLALKSSIYMRKMLNESSRKNIDIQSVIQLEPNINRLGYFERFLLYQSWVEKYMRAKQQEVDQLCGKYNEKAELLKELRLQEDRQIFQDAYIVAMTTTGSSRYHSVLKDIGPRIVIVEEAAEVFESHIVASLSKNCEHLILIGDHIQLRPNPAVYKLAKDFDFDVSLFERLVKNDTRKVLEYSSSIRFYI